MNQEIPNVVNTESGDRGPEASREIQDAERRVLHERLRVLVRTISGKPNLEVTTQVDPQTLIQMAAQGIDARRTWYREAIHDPRTRKFLGERVHIPEEIVEDENSARGIAAHEAGHVAITRSSEFVPDSVLQQLGFHDVLASLEERPTDQVVRDRYEGAGEWVDEARKNELEKSHKAWNEAVNIGYVPKFKQFCNLIVYGPHTENVEEQYDPEVLELYRALNQHIENVEHALPEEGAPEQKILAKAKTRYKIAYTKVWPEVKKLVKKDMGQEALRQMVQDSVQSSSGKQKPEDILSQLSSELAKELEEMVSKALEAIKKSEEEKGKEKALLNEGMDAARPDSIPLPMDKMSPELREALEKIFHKLVQEIRQKLLEKAKEILESIEDADVEQRAAKLSQEPEETHKEYHERHEKEHQKELEELQKKLKRKEHERIKDEEKRQTAKELQEIEQTQAALQESQSEYDRAYDAVRTMDDELYQILEEIFTPNVKRTMKLKSSGSRMNLPALYRWESGRGAGASSIDSRIFESLHLPEKKDYVFTLLIDLSGSMQNEKIQQTFKAVVLLCEVLNRLGIPFEVLGFQDTVIRFKNFGQEFRDVIRKKISGMILETENENPGGHNNANINDDGPCLLYASKSLAAQAGKEKFLLVLSDGLPVGPSGAGGLERAVELVLRTTGQKLIGLGVGPGTEHVSEYYPVSMPNIEIEKIVEILGGLLRDIIENPDKYAYLLEAKT